MVASSMPVRHCWAIKNRNLAPRGRARYLHAGFDVIDDLCEVHTGQKHRFATYSRVTAIASISISLRSVAAAPFGHIPSAMLVDLRISLFGIAKILA